MKKVLMIVGSLRKDSFNGQLAGRIGELLAERAEVSFLDYEGLPFMNQDLEFPAPEPVAAVRRAVLEADGVWIVSPEYNHQIPGVLKNLLDWLSRPLDIQDRQRGTAVKGKPVTISGAAGKSGASYVLRHLSELLAFMSMELVSGLGTGVSLGAEAFGSGKLVLTEAEKASLVRQTEEFLGRL